MIVRASGRAPLVVTLALTLAVAGLIQVPPVQALPEGWDPARYMSVSEVRPGMTGTGRTVLAGHAIEEFDVEILGVLPTAFPGGDMILARLSGLDLERIGVAAGMSGSPIYIEGRLLGALAFGWPFAMDPITGITPIENMLDLDARPQALPMAQARSTGWSLPAWESLLAARGAEALEVLSAGGSATDGPAPLRVPIAMSGFGDAAQELAVTLFEDHGFVAVQGGDSGDRVPSGSALEPGSPIGVQLLRGDASLAAIGTVTWTDGDRILAFGHRMLGLGNIAYPMTEAHIVTVMPRRDSSFKMGVAGAPIGAITRDYRTGVQGTVGGAATMIPMTLDLRLGDRAVSHRYELLDANGLTPALAGLVAVNAMVAGDRASGPTTLRLRTRVTLGDGREVSTQNMLAGFSPPSQLAGEVARLVGLVHGNPFEAVRITGIAVTAEMEHTVEAAFLEQISVASGPFHPGDTVPVRLVLRDYRGGSATRDLEIALPASMGAGTFTLQVCDGARDARLEQERAPERYTATDLDRLFAILGEDTPFDAVVIRLLGSSPNPVVGGRELPQLPISAKSLLVSRYASGRASRAARGVIAESVTRLGKVVIGCQTLELTVEEPQ